MIRLQLCGLLLARGLRRAGGALAAAANTSSSSSGAPPGAGEQQRSAIRAASSSASSAPPAGEDAADAARELGLDSLPIPQLRELLASAVPRESDLGVLLPPPKQRKLTYADIAGYQELLQQLVDAPDTYAADTPRAPALDAGQWVDTHFKQYGLGFEPRSGFYVWRAWAAAHLPPEQLETLLAMEQAMGDDDTRSALLKQAQHELARLWDWQHRRAALGLSPDLPPTAAAAASSSSGGAAEVAGAVTHRAAAEGSAVAGAEDAAAAAAAADLHEAASSNSDSGSSSGDEGASVAGAAELAEKGMLEVLEGSGALSSSEQAAAAAAAAACSNDTAAAAASAADQFDDVMAGSDGWQGGSGRLGAGAITFSAEDVAADAGAGESDRVRQELTQRAAGLAAQPHMRRPTLTAVQKKLDRGEQTAENGRYRNTEGVVLRVYRPVADDDDLFLPSLGFGSRQVSAALADPSRTRPVDPRKVVAQAVALAEAARRASASAGASAGLGLGLDLDADADAAGGGGQGEWSALPLLDRTVLHTQQLAAEAARLAARPKRQQRWRLLPLQPYAFDLQCRPPTATLDLLSAYLEVRYADVLLRQDAARSLTRRLAAARVAARPGGASELLESPPAALAAAASLSAAERGAIETQLDGLLATGQYGRYRKAVLQLYCDGLASWDELQACWAAAQAGQELANAAAAPVAIAGDRADLFAVVSGQKQLGSLGGSSSRSSANRAAAKQLWEAAGQKLGGDWAAAAHAAAASSSSNDSSSGSQAWWQQPVAYEQAERTWQQLLQLAGMPDGPAFERVLLAGSSDSDSTDKALQQQLAALQASLAQATGLPASAAADLAPDDFESLKQLCAAPPSLEQLLQQHWEQLSEQELGRKLTADAPAWQQLWPLLQRLTEQAQAQQEGDAAAPAGLDAAALFDRFVAESEVAPLTPPPYPGARKVLRWEQRIMLHAASGQTLLPAEVKVRLAVSAAELQQEAGLSAAGLRHLLDVAGSRYDASSGMLSLACDRFPTREENRRWCLEALHRLLQEAQERYPSPRFLLLREAAAGVAAA